MPVEAKPLFRPDVLRPYLSTFQLPARVEAVRPKLRHWAELLASRRADAFKEQEILPDFLTDFFCELLGYARPADGGQRYTISRERHVEVDGKFADAVLGDFNGHNRPVVAIEGKGPKDPLDRPFAGRRMSAVDQAYRYAINLPCDWIVVTSVRQTRLYHKGSDQQTYERFDTEDLAASENLLKRFVFLLGAERVVPADGACHFFSLLSESEKVGRRLTKEFYIRYADMRQDAFNRLCEDNPAVPKHDVLSSTQKLLDRVLFCAFSEDRGLLPVETIRKAYEHRDPYHPRPIWETFRGLFDAINRGNAALGIHAYNGGLFAPDAILDGLQVSDAVCGYFHDLGTYDYRPPHQAAQSATGENLIDVDVLGHIFEQSITDLEKLRNELDGLAEPVGVEKHKTRRKKEGAFYTPSFITRYIIEQTLGGVLKDRFERLRQTHERQAKGAARAALVEPAVYETEKLKKPALSALVKFWEAWQDELGAVRLLDPACGSGAFLIEAFDQLHAAYETSNDRLQELRGHRTLFDLDKRILENNLYGADLNEEAIEICRLSLWIKTAERGKALTSLDHTIRVGNSVVSDPAVHPKAFDWRAAFPEVFEAGGFDVVVGNPPYIRQEWLAPFKPHWQTAFESFDGVADIFTYFFEQGLQLLRTGGRLAFITSGSWVRGNYGAALRKYIAETAAIESVIDFGEYQPFEEAEMIRPSITVLKKGRTGGDMRLFKWLTAGSPPENLSEVIASAPKIATSHLGEHAWELESDDVRALRARMAAKGTKLLRYCGKLLFAGIKTGRNEAFIIDRRTRDNLIEADPKSSEIIHPYLMGTDVQHWHVVPRDRFLIFTKQGIDIASFPAVREYLEQFREILTPKQSSSDRGPGRKPGPYKWYEIQDSTDFFRHFHAPKIVWPDIAKLPRFVLDRSAAYLDMTCFMVPLNDLYLYGILSSWATWFYISKTSQPLRLRGDRWQYRLKKQFMENVPIPEASADDRTAIGRLAEESHRLGAARYEVQSKVQHRLRQTFGDGADGQPLGVLNNKAQAWWEASANELGAALKTSFKLSANPFKNPRTADEWEPYLAEKRAEVDRLTRKLADCESELNDRVYRLFQLTPTEIALLEREVEH